MKLALGATLVTACAALVGAAAAASAQQVSLGGVVATVRDAAGRPISRALVTATGPQVRSATTNAAGIVTILGLPMGTYTIRVTCSGFVPGGEVVRLGGSTFGVRVVPFTVAADDFATLASETASASVTTTRGEGAPYAAQPLTHDLSATILGSAAGAFGAAAPVLEATRPGETRTELDGIPLAGGAANPNVLRFRSALDLADVSLAEGPVWTTPNLNGAIGGIVDYRTPRISQAFSTAVDLGTDSAFGDFEHVRLSDTFGKIGVLVDGVDSSAGNSATELKGHVAFSRSTSLDVAAYGAHDVAVENGTTVASDAPAYAANLRTTIGSDLVQARIFGSYADLSAPAGTPDENQNWRTRGFTINDSLPFGENLVTVGYDRRTDDATFGTGPVASQSVDTLRLDTDLQVWHLSRLSLGDDLESGTELPHRNDPHASLIVRTGGAATLTFAAGSAYETVPDALLVLAPGAAFAPETSFGYRAGAEILTSQSDRVRVAAFEMRRFNSFAERSDARSAGIELGFARPSLPGRLGIDAGLDLARTYEFGSREAAERFLAAPVLLAGEQLAQEPFSKARLGLSYAIDSYDVEAGATELGANNAFSDRAVTLGDVGVRFGIGSVGALRAGIENLFGATAADPEFSLLFPPREFTLTLER